MQPKKNEPQEFPSKPGPELPPDHIPEEPTIPKEDPDIIPDEDPFKTPPTEIPPATQGP
ncbi:hypothetical protein [Ferruginibacter albus]|uniref:hypothetical protein n=1 Tax=Ferruginibacter albus TaxID=2875540 RepID=UPI001CC3E08C|nr:hypothetical protein [Ferruginibacter albus]UAY51557.1 hypothetical protein K9M53_13290 [Ferruginibacter albus]